jgi:hypothetical protein
VVTPELLASGYGVKARLLHLDAEPFVIVEGSLARPS